VEKDREVEGTMVLKMDSTSTISFKKEKNIENMIEDNVRQYCPINNNCGIVSNNGKCMCSFYPHIKKAVEIVYNKN
jgi:hypothetical protein